MNEAKRMAQLYQSVYVGDEQGEAWHGPALKPLLKDVTAEQASQDPKMGQHSILQLVLHIAYWEEVVLRRLHGEIVDAPLNSPDDWPSNRKASAADWQAVLARLEKSHNDMLKAIEECSEETLLKTVPGRNFDNYILLHGIIDHCVYHSAQIALIKRSLS
jgi:uncharacterized damage-inducible protein DinB